MLNETLSVIFKHREYIWIFAPKILIYYFCTKNVLPETKKFQNCFSWNKIKMRHFWWFSNTVTKLLRLSSLPTTNARQTQASLVCHDLEKITCVERFELGLLETRESFDQLEKLEWMVRSRKRGKFSRSTPSSSVAWGSKKTRNLLNTGAAQLSPSSALSRFMVKRRS